MKFGMSLLAAGALVLGTSAMLWRVTGVATLTSISG